MYIITQICPIRNKTSKN